MLKNHEFSTANVRHF